MYHVTEEQVVQTVAPAAEPVTTTQAKRQVNVTGTDDDTLIADLIKAAREQFEQDTGRALVKRTYRADLPYFSDKIVLPWWPIIAISQIQYYDTNSPSTLQTLSSSVYALSQHTVRRNYQQTWPNTYPRNDAVQITYTAGYASTSSPEDPDENIPPLARQGVLLAVADFYENREIHYLGASVSMSQTYWNIVNRFRVFQ